MEETAGLLDDLYGVEVVASLEPQDGLHTQVGEVVFVPREDLRGEGCASYVHQVLTKLHRVISARATGRHQ